MTEKEKSILALEYELTTLARMLEALNRSRNYPLERAHYLLLLQIRDSPLSVGELALRLLLDNSTVTRQINVMLKKNLIQKIPNPEDGRSILIAPTVEGSTMAETMHQLRLDRLHSSLKNWSNNDTESLAGLVHRLTRDLVSNIQSK